MGWACEGGLVANYYSNVLYYLMSEEKMMI